MQQPQDQERYILKSSMPNPINIQSLRSDKRFEALVKQEMIEHQHIISSHHQEMQALRDSISTARERFDSLFEHCEMQMNDMALFYNQQIFALKEKEIGNETTISDQKKTIESLHKQLNEFHDIYASKATLEKLKDDFGLQIKANTISHLNSFQEFQREFKALILSLQNDLFKLRDEIELKLARLTETGASNFLVSKLDRDGVLKQVQIYEKSMFIIEKKIENIYTLIERINKRGEICHKLE